MNKYQRVGLHVSAAGGVENAPENAKEFGAEVFQFFSRSPRGGGAPKISDEQATLFRQRSKEYGFESYIHSPYYINFASKNKRIYHGSINAIREELERGSALGVKYVVTHMGSAKEWVDGKTKERVETPKAALDQAIEGLRAVFEQPHFAKASQPSRKATAGTARGEKQFTSKLLLEISAGSGSIVGDTFAELAYLLDGVGRDDIHVCLDTCHMFASGYDLRTQETLDETMKQFRKALTISQLKLVHINDSKTDLGGRSDRHEHIGKGKIGETGFKALFKHKDFQKVNFILETKHDTLITKDLAFLKKHRKAT